MQAERRDMERFPSQTLGLNFDPDMAANCVDAVARCHRRKIEEKTHEPQAKPNRTQPQSPQRNSMVTMMYKWR